jgi:hypothetical protein
MRWGLWCAIILAGTAVYTFFIKEAADTFDKFYEFKLAKCTDAARTVAQLATDTNPDELTEAAQRFDQLYYGELALFEGAELDHAMVQMRFLLTVQDPNKNPRKDLPIDVGRMLYARNASGNLFVQSALKVSTACYREVAPSVIRAMADRIYPPVRDAFAPPNPFQEK